jgi:hypothetical protein
MRLINWAVLSAVAGMSSCSLAVATAPVTSLTAPQAAKAALASAPALAPAEAARRA